MTVDDLQARIITLEMNFDKLQNQSVNIDAVNIDAVNYLTNFFDVTRIHKLIHVMDKLDSFLYSNPNNLNDQMLQLSSEIHDKSHRLDETQETLKTAIELLLEIVITDYPELVLKHLEKIDKCKKAIGEKI